MLLCVARFLLFFFFFFNDTAPTEIYTLSLHDALPICYPVTDPERYGVVAFDAAGQAISLEEKPLKPDRKSTRLNSSHMSISYAVFCLKKKKKKETHSIIKKKKKNL